MSASTSHGFATDEMTAETAKMKLLVELADLIQNSSADPDSALMPDSCATRDQIVWMDRMSLQSCVSSRHFVHPDTSSAMEPIAFQMTGYATASWTVWTRQTNSSAMICRGVTMISSSVTMASAFQVFTNATTSMTATEERTSVFALLPN